MGALKIWLSRVSVKNVIAVSLFLGITPPAVMWVFQRAPLFFFSYAFQTQARADSIRTARMIDTRATDLESTLVTYMGKRFDRQEQIMVAIPGARRAYLQDSLKKARDDQAAIQRLRMFPREPIRFQPAHPERP